jgi:hypothetical protein
VSIPCDADDFAEVRIAVTDNEPADDDWQPAFRDYDGRGRRTAAIPYRGEYEGRTAWLMVDGLGQRTAAIRS